MAVKPHLIVRCACGKGMALELGYGKRIKYTGMSSARILANIFIHFHTGQYCNVTEEVKELE